MEKSTPYRNAWYRDLLEKEKELKEYTDNAISALGDITKVKFIDISLAFPTPVDVENTAIAYYGLGIDESKKIINGETSFFNLNDEELSNYDLIILNLWIPLNQVSGHIIKLQVPAILNRDNTNVQLISMEIGAVFIGIKYEVYISIGTTIETGKDLISFGRNKTLLPIVSALDNGKILGVENGEWSPANFTGDIIVVPIEFSSDFSSFTLVDMTISELSILCDNNKDKLVVLQDNDSVFPPLYRIFYYTDPNEPIFGSIRYRAVSTAIMVYRSESGSTNTFNRVSDLRIPAPTAANNDKLLGVVNGAYSFVDAPKEEELLFTLKLATVSSQPGTTAYLQEMAEKCTLYLGTASEDKAIHNSAKTGSDTQYLANAFNRIRNGETFKVKLITYHEGIGESYKYVIIPTQNIFITDSTVALQVYPIGEYLTGGAATLYLKISYYNNKDNWEFNQGWA